MTFRRTIVTAVVLLLPWGSASAQAPSVDWRAVVEREARAIDFSGVVLVAAGKDVLVREAFGYADPEWQVKTTFDTRFRIASLTKSFTAACMLTLVDRKKLDLDATIDKFLDETPEGWRGITIRHLLSHTSGIPCYSTWPEFGAFMRNAVTTDEILRRALLRPVDFPPGGSFGYSNTGYFLAQSILEKSSGQSFETFLKRNILRPAELKDTGLDRDGQIIPHRARGLSRDRNGKPIVAPFCSMSWMGSAGGMYSTVDDLLKWVRALFSGKVVRTATFEDSLKPLRSTYACGWAVTEYHGCRIVSHGARMAGFSGAVHYLPETDRAVVLLSNDDHAPISRLDTQLLRALIDGDSKAATNETMSPIDEFVGRYRFDDGRIVTVSKTPDGLSAATPDADPAEMTRIAATDDFWTSRQFALFEFSRRSRRSAAGLTIHRFGMHLSARRIE